MRHAAGDRAAGDWVSAGATVTGDFWWFQWQSMRLQRRREKRLLNHKRALPALPQPSSLPSGHPGRPLLNSKASDSLLSLENTLLGKNKGLVRSRAGQPASFFRRQSPQQPEMLRCSGSAAENEGFLCKNSKEKATVSFDHTSCWRLPLYLSFGFFLFFFFLLKKNPPPHLFLH